MAAKKQHADKNGNGSASKGERIAIVAGLRTPFAKQGTDYRDVSALDLGKIVTSELLVNSAGLGRRPLLQCCPTTWMERRGRRGCGRA